MNRFLLVFALLFNCIFVSLKAENFSVTAHIDSSFLFIGEQAGLSFEVIQQKNEKVFDRIYGVCRVVLWCIRAHIA